jgi:hypothetical protein
MDNSNLSHVMIDNQFSRLDVGQRRSRKQGMAVHGGRNDCRRLLLAAAKVNIASHIFLLASKGHEYVESIIPQLAQMN